VLARDGYLWLSSGPWVGNVVCYIFGFGRTLWGGGLEMVIGVGEEGSMFLKKTFPRIKAPKAPVPRLEGQFFP